MTHGRHICLFGRQGFAEGDSHWIGEPLRPLAEKPTALKRKDGPPELVHPHGHDGLTALLGNDLEAFLEPQQRAGAGEFALWEYAHDLAGLEALGGGAHPVAGVRGRDRDGLEEPQDGVEDGVLVERVEDQEADRPRAADLQDDSVHPGDVVGQEQAAAGLGDAVTADEMDAVDQPEENRAEEPDGARDERAQRRGGRQGVGIRRSAHGRTWGKEGRDQFGGVVKMPSSWRNGN